jgi:hypothetical protein
MSTNRFRLPLVAFSVAMMALLGACSDAMGPDAAARRSGYITSASSTNSAVSARKASALSPIGVSADTTSTKADSLLQPSSGYNVPALRIKSGSTATADSVPPKTEPNSGYNVPALRIRSGSTVAADSLPKENKPTSGYNVPAL